MQLFLLFACEIYYLSVPLNLSLWDSGVCQTNGVLLLPAIFHMRLCLFAA